MGIDEKLSIGQTLRQGRQAQGLTPEQAALQSKVPLRLLQALEADDYRQLPDAGYLIRFLHEYARLLKLDTGALEGEFRRVIRRPPGSSLVAVPPPAPPPAIPWRQVLWTGAAILVITPLVVIALSLASKRAAERPGQSRLAEESTGKPAPAERAAPAEEDGAGLVDRLLPWRSEGPPPETALPPGEMPGFLQERPAGSAGSGPAGSSLPAPPSRAAPRRGSPAESPAPSRAVSSPPVPPTDRRPRRFLLTVRALEPTWMAVRADGGQARQVLLAKGQAAWFAAEAGFVITLGNAGGVDLNLNGERIPSLGGSGQVIRNLALPPIPRPPDALGTALPRGPGSAQE